MQMKKTFFVTLNLAAIVLLLLLPHYGPFPFFTYAPICLLMVIGVLKLQQAPFSVTGFRFSDFSIKIIPIGLAVAIGWISVYHFLIQPLLSYTFHITDADVSDFYFIRKHFINYLFIVLAAWLVAGGYEEIIFRGFIQSRFAELFKTKKYGFLLASCFTSLLFGLYHIQQGPSGVIHATLFGFLCSFLLNHFKGNLWYGMIFHAFYDTLALTLIYLGY